MIGVDLGASAQTWFHAIILVKGSHSMNPSALTMLLVFSEFSQAMKTVSVRLEWREEGEVTFSNASAALTQPCTQFFSFLNTVIVVINKCPRRK